MLPPDHQNPGPPEYAWMLHGGQAKQAGRMLHGPLQEAPVDRDAMEARHEMHHLMHMMPPVGMGTVHNGDPRGLTGCHPHRHSVYGTHAHSHTQPGPVQSADRWDQTRRVE